MVDTVLYFEGDTHTSFRLIRAFKNRFGAVNEIGVFAMTEKGLREVTNPSALFLSQHHAGVAGLVRDGDAGRHAPAAGGAAGAGGRCARHGAQAAHRGPRAEPPRDAARGAAPPRGHRLLRPGRVRQRGGRRAHRRARRGPRGDARDRLEPAQPARCPTSTWCSARWGSRARCGPVQRGQERLREAAKLGFTHAIIPAANRPQASRSRASR